MEGPLNYYRTTKLRYEEEKGKSVHLTSTKKIPERGKSVLDSGLPLIPRMFIYGSSDRSCTEQHLRIMQRFAPQVKVVRLERVAHWVMVEARDQITDLITEFVYDLTAVKGRL